MTTCKATKIGHVLGIAIDSLYLLRWYSYSTTQTKHQLWELSILLHWFYIYGYTVPDYFIYQFSQEIGEYGWTVIAVLDGNLKLKMEPSSTCIPYCGEIDVFVTLQARDICKLLKLILPVSMCVISVVFNGDQWNYRGQAFSTNHLVYYTTSFNETNLLH